MYRYRKKFDSVPHAIIATHFETIAPLLIKGFGASTDRDKLELPERAENVSLYFLESDNPDIAKIVINFRDKSVEANFNLKTFHFE